MGHLRLLSLIPTRTQKNTMRTTHYFLIQSSKYLRSTSFQLRKILKLHILKLHGTTWTIIMKNYDIKIQENKEHAKNETISQPCVSRSSTNFVHGSNGYIVQLSDRGT